MGGMESARQRLKCKVEILCGCENPEPAEGAALVSNSCPIHTELNET